MAHEELKSRQGAMWGEGRFERVAETTADVHDLVVDRLAPEPGAGWLDVACGTGSVAERAARAGAEVVGVDIAPVLVQTARERAAQLGLAIDYRVGDCERLDLPSGAFGRVSSTFGVMFAPDHAAAARELARVTAPGGRLALANWTPTGGVARMFGMMAAFQPAPPPSDPFAWGTAEHVRDLLEGAFDIEIEEHVSTLRIGSAEDYWQLFSTSFGPAKTLADSLGDRREDFHRAWVDFFEREYAADGGIEHTREYLLVLGRRRG